MTQKEIDRLSLLQRAGAPTPKLFRLLRNLGLVLTAVSGIILTVPAGWSETVTLIAGYVAVAGSILTTVSQLAVKG